jgi:uncharacterized membrane protein
VANLDIAVATYEDADDAELDWLALENLIENHRVEVADAALIQNRGGENVVMERQSRHGWGKGAVVGAAVGILFPPSVLAAAAVGAGGGELAARMRRALGNQRVKDLGESLRPGSIAIVVACPERSTNQVSNTLKNARTTTTAPSGTLEEIQDSIQA